MADKIGVLILKCSIKKLYNESENGKEALLPCRNDRKSEKIV